MGFRVQVSGSGFRVRGFGCVGSYLIHPNALLGGPWVVISGVISRVTIIIAHIRALISLPITTHEPPSMRKLYGH